MAGSLYSAKQLNIELNVVFKQRKQKHSAPSHQKKPNHQENRLVIAPAHLIGLKNLFDSRNLKEDILNLMRFTENSKNLTMFASAIYKKTAAVIAKIHSLMLLPGDTAEIIKNEANEQNDPKLFNNKMVKFLQPKLYNNP